MCQHFLMVITTVLSLQHKCVVCVSAGRSVFWLVLSLRVWRSPPGCLWFLMMENCCSAEVTGTTAWESHLCWKAKLWDSISATWVTQIKCYRSHRPPYTAQCVVKCLLQESVNIVWEKLHKNRFYIHRDWNDENKISIIKDKQQQNI